MKFVVLALLFAMPAYGETGSHSDAPLELSAAVPRPVVSFLVSAEAARNTVFIGTVASENETSLGFPVGGTMAERLVEVGEVVHEGQVLARLNPEDFEADLRGAEAGVLVAKTQVRSATDARARANELALRGVSATTRLEDAERGLVAAQARLEQAQAQLTRAQDMLGRAELHAPLDGVVTNVYEDSGASLSPGQNVLLLAGVNSREIIMDLSEQDIASLDLGLEFNAALVANSSVYTTATLVRINPVAEKTTRSRRLHLMLDSPPDGFRFGALVELRAADNADVGVSLPMDAVLGFDDAPQVWVVNRADNTVTKRAITLGDQFGNRIRVTNGLNEGDEVVLKGIHSLKDGQKVGRSISQ